MKREGFHQWISFILCQTQVAAFICIYLWTLYSLLWSIFSLSTITTPSWISYLYIVSTSGDMILSSLFSFFKFVLLVPISSSTSFIRSFRKSNKKITNMLENEANNLKKSRRSKEKQINKKVMSIIIKVEYLCGEFIFPFLRWNLS